MKEVNEYSENDLMTVKTQARQIAMFTIHHVYEDLHEEEEIDCEDVKKVKEAVEILNHTSNMVK